MKRAATAAAICAGLMPGVANAYDWSLRSTQSETVELNNNLYLNPSPQWGWGSYSTLTADAETHGKDWKFDILGSGTYRKVGGPATEGGSTTEFLTYNFNGHFEHSEKNVNFDREFLDASWSQTSTALALLNEFGFITQASGFLNREMLAGGIDRALTKVDTLSLYATSTHTFYDPSGGGVPVTDSLARAAWQHSVTSTLSADLSSEAEFLQYDNAAKTQAEIYRNQVGINATLSPLLSFRANAGPILIVAKSGSSPLASLGSTAGVSATSSSLLDWIGSASLSYRFLKNTTFSFVALQSIGPSVVGSLYKNDAVTASISQVINSKSSLSFSASAAETSSTIKTPYASASVTYSYQLLQELSAQLTYRHQHRFASTGGITTIDPITGTPTTSGTTVADSDSILIVLSHSNILVPNGP